MRICPDVCAAATTRICADGGANRLYDQIVEMLPGVDSLTARTSFLPDLIKVRIALAYASLPVFGRRARVLICALPVV